MYAIDKRLQRSVKAAGNSFGSACKSVFAIVFAIARSWALRPSGSGASEKRATEKRSERNSWASRVLARFARLLVSRTPMDRRHEPKARGETERRNGYP
jgi:hypothetical protein